MNDMKTKQKFFITNGNGLKGPFSVDELRNERITEKTKIWYEGLDNWKNISECDSVASIFYDNSVFSKINRNKKARKKRVVPIVLAAVVMFSIMIMGFVIINHQKEKMEFRDKIRANSYAGTEDFDIYVKKFYRDIAVYGIFPKKPKQMIIKFSKLDQMDNATHIHGLSFGKDDDDRIEIYINPTTWKKFNKPMRYWLMYHELAHDVLNVDDLKDLTENKGKLMYPNIASYEHKTMDEFIERSHELFEEVAAKQSY